MPAHVIVWDIETVPDLKGFAAANGHDGKTDDEMREAIGDKFPKHIYHSIICIGALVARRDNSHWEVTHLGAPCVGERSEKELITGFVNRIAELNPQLVTFNGSGFDLPGTVACASAVPTNAGSAPARAVASANTSAILFNIVILLASKPDWPLLMRSRHRHIYSRAPCK